MLSAYTQKWIRDTFPPATINNSRRIARELLSKWENHKSERLAEEIYRKLGLTVDFINSDLNDR